MKRNLGWALICAGAVVFAGCGMGTSEPTTPQPGEPGTETGISLTFELGAVEDVEGMRFHIDTCDGEEVTTEDVAISELDLGAIEELGIEDEGAVQFADYFAVVEAGCYNVEIQPLDGDGEPVEFCSPAMAEGVEVEAGRTTEIIMVSQCGGDDFGGLDVLGVLNFEPTITMLTFDPSKIVGCGAVEVCVSAVDSDGDGIEFEWDQLAGPTPAVGPDVTTSTVDNGVSKECVEMTPGYTGAYTFEVVAYDLMEDADGTLVRVEDLVSESHEGFESRSSLKFPLYVSCEEPPEDVLDEIEDEKPKKDDEEEDVLEEIEDEKPKKDEDPEDVLEEIEDEKPKKDEDPEDVLEEIEDEKPKKDEDPEDVLEEIEDEKPKKDDPEDVLEEIEDPKKDLPEDVLEEIETVGKDVPEDVLDEIEDDFRKDVLGEVEDCTRPIEYWKKGVAWPTDADTLLLGKTWLAIVQADVDMTRNWSQLAGQYVVALLNLKSGADAPKGVLLVLEEAGELLEYEQLQGVDRVRAKDLKAILYAYNRGVIGPDAC